jgi:hypothetical protein
LVSPLNIIQLALKVSGVLSIGQAVSAEDENDCFNLMNMMLGQWNRKRWLVPYLMDIAYQADGSQSYTVGVGGQFNLTQRIDQIEYAYVRQLLPTNNLTGQVDYPLDVIESYEDYASLSLKSLVSFPSGIFFDSAYPLGNLFVYPIPNDNFEIHIIVKSDLVAFANLTDPIILPLEYQEPLVFNLAARLRPLYQLPPDPTITGLATAGLHTIRSANFQIPRLRMPPGLGRNNTGYASHGIGGIYEGVFTLNETVLG